MSHESSHPTPRKPWFKRWWVWVIAATILIAGVSQGFDTSTPTATTPQSAAPTPTETRASEAASEQPTEEPSESAEEEAGPTVAEQVEAAVLDGNAVDSFQGLPATSPGFYVTELEDMGADTIRAHVQEQLADADRERTAHWLANMSCTDVPDLDTIVVRDTSGIDSNHYLREIEGLLPACRD